MAEERQYKPLVKLTGLYENVSKRTGDTYFSGYLGNVKVVVLRDKNAEQGKPGWSLCVQEKDPKPDQGQGQGQANGGYSHSQGYQSQTQNQGYGQSQQQNKGYGQSQLGNGYPHTSPPGNSPPPANSSAAYDDVPF